MKKEGLYILSAFLRGKSKGVFLYTNTGDKAVSYLFLNPVAEIKCDYAADIESLLMKAEKLNSKDYYLAGYLTYETGSLLAKSKLKSINYKKPIFYLWAFEKPYIFHRHALKYTPLFSGLSLKPNISKNEYLKNFSFLKEQISNGEVYQVNYTFKMKGKYKGDLEQLFYFLCNRQKTSYSAFIRDGKNVIMSFSPELFFEKNGNKISMKPMKGTLLKPCTKNQIQRFKKDEKTSAENIMIVDLIRNDLGKICITGSIKTNQMRKVEEYESLYQMTSTVTGTLSPKIGFKAMIDALFPSGSVTGAPKIKAMQLINKIEKEPRGVYTGAIGFVESGFKKAVFNIPIRTVVIDTKTHNVDFGTGSGIVHDSKGQAEYEECIGKVKFITKIGSQALLIESLLLKNKKYFLLSQHIKRLKNSAEFFSIKIDLKKVHKQLKRVALTQRSGSSWKVRLLVYANGHTTIERETIKANTVVVKKIVLSKKQTNSRNILLAHKTTDRRLYDTEYEKYQKNGYYDVIFTNEKNEITEAHASNIIIKKKGYYYTPPVSCGLLAGTYRNYLMTNGYMLLKERVLYFKDLKTAEAVYLCNSVIGIRKVTLL